jgi:hypothetical protein
MRIAGIETFRIEDSRQSDDRIELIDRTVGFDPRRIFCHPLPAD